MSGERSRRPHHTFWILFGALVTLSACESEIFLFTLPDREPAGLPSPGVSPSPSPSQSASPSPTPSASASPSPSASPSYDDTDYPTTPLSAEPIETHPRSGHLYATAKMYRVELVVGWNKCGTGTYPAAHTERAPYYAYLPTGGSALPQAGKYPVVLFMHGSGEQAGAGNACYNAASTIAGQVTTNLRKLETSAAGPTTAIRDSKFSPPEAMVVLAVQSQYWGGFPNTHIDTVLRDAAFRLKRDYDVELDPDRVYLTGLSMGGAPVHNYVVTYPNRIAAMVPIEAANTPSPCGVVNSGVPFWGFSGKTSGAMYSAGLGQIVLGTGSCKRETKGYTPYGCTMTDSRFGSSSVSCTQVVSSDPEGFRGTWMPNNGHSGWKEIYNSTHSALPPGETIYSWMLQFKNSDRGDPPYPFH